MPQIDFENSFAALNDLKNEVNQLLGFHEGIPRINYGPCGVFAFLFYQAWNRRFAVKVHICFVMTPKRDECDHVVIRLPHGQLYDGGVGVHSDSNYLPQFVIDEMLDYDHDTLEKWSYGLDRTYPRFCPDFNRQKIQEIIERHLDRLMMKVKRVGNTVHREIGPWTPSVHALFTHLRSGGFLNAPEVLGFDNQGREILSYLEGEVGHDPLSTDARSDTALKTAARLLRAYHDHTVDFVKIYQGEWQLPAHPPIEVICHGDYAPYNCVLQGDQVVGIIDFDTAHPGSRIWDIAYAVYRFAPLMAPDNPAGFGDQAEQIRRAKLFFQEYGLSDLSQLIPTILERLSVLVDFIKAQATAGDPFYQKAVDEGHCKLYLTDCRYIQEQLSNGFSGLSN